MRVSDIVMERPFVKISISTCQSKAYSSCIILYQCKKERLPMRVSVNGKAIRQSICQGKAYFSLYKFKGKGYLCVFLSWSRKGPFVKVSMSRNELVGGAGTGSIYIVV